jgi:hypothetical protein
LAFSKEIIMAQIALKFMYGENWLLLKPGLVDQLSSCKALGSVGYGDDRQYYKLSPDKFIHVEILPVEEITIHDTRQAAEEELKRREEAA